VDGRVVAYRFRFGDGSFTDWVPNGTMPHVFTVAGTYDATVEVRDDLGFVSKTSAKAKVTVLEKEEPTGVGKNLSIDIIWILVPVIFIIVVIMAFLVYRKGQKGR
jgi:hypothetical protein